MKHKPPTRPVLNRVPLESTPLIEPGKLLVTMSVGQWDGFLQAAYDRGALLLELDDDEKPVALYRKDTPKNN